MLARLLSARGITPRSRRRVRDRTRRSWHGPAGLWLDPSLLEARTTEPRRRDESPRPDVKGAEVNAAKAISHRLHNRYRLGAHPGLQKTIENVFIPRDV